MLTTLMFSGETFYFDNEKLILSFDLREPYYSAGKTFKWFGKTVGIGINKTALLFAIEHQCSIRVKVAGNIWRANPLTWLDFCRKHKSIHVANGVEIYVMRWIPPYFEKIHEGQISNNSFVQ